MINTYVMQDIMTDNDRRGMTRWVGFAIDRKAGMIRILASKLQREGVSITVDDIVDTLNYMLARGWIVLAGMWGLQQLYTVKAIDHSKQKRRI